MLRRPRYPQTTPRSGVPAFSRAVAIWGGLTLVAVGVIYAVQYIDDRFLTEYHAETESWEPTEISEDGRTITLRFETPQCEDNPFDHVEVIETASAVELTVITRYGGGGGCDDVAVPRTTKVELKEPLRDRKLIDGRTGRAPDLGSR